MALGRAVRLLAAAAVGSIAFALYYSTLLPGFDFGDTPSFQVMAGAPAVSPRDAYPLYFAVGRLFAAVIQDPARALNVASAVEGALACSLLLLLAIELGASLPAAAAGTLFFAGSYTFWSQSVLAEVYALHMCGIAATMILLVRWGKVPTTARLTWFLAAYALAFGNHLSMILLAPAYALFALAAAPRGWRSLLTGRIVGLALLLAAAGAAQYLWNLHSLWRMPLAPLSGADAVRTFWFDVTKSDWRETMVLNVPASMTLERLQMYGFDAVQQFGPAGLLLAAAGVCALAARGRRHGLLIGGAYIVNVMFALAYNVGDSHVFFLPAHLMVALLIAAGVTFLGRRRPVREVVALLACAIAAARIYHEYPALDRSADVRPSHVLGALTAGIDDRNGILLADMNWQIQNGLTYYAKEVNPILVWARMPDVLLYAPALIRDNHAIGRDVALTERAATELQISYGPLFATTSDSRIHTATMSEMVAGLAPGTPYVVCVLKPTHEFRIDRTDLTHSLEALTGGALHAFPDVEYLALAGLTGSAPAAIAAGNRPFRRSLSLNGLAVELRMESWLAFDTIRRMGFGQVVAGRHHALIVERGVSFVAMDPSGRPLQSAYFANIFAAQPRFVVQAR